MWVKATMYHRLTVDSYLGPRLSCTSIEEVVNPEVVLTPGRVAFPIKATVEGNDYHLMLGHLNASVGENTRTFGILHHGKLKMYTGLLVPRGSQYPVISKTATRSDYSRRRSFADIVGSKKVGIITGTVWSSITG